MFYNAIDDLEETGKIVAFLGKDRKAPYIKREPLYPCRANDHGEHLRTSTQPSPVHKPRLFLTAPPPKNARPPFAKSLVQNGKNTYNKIVMSGIWKKQFGDMNAGIVKITVAERVAQNCIQKNAPSTENPFPDNKLSQILKVKTLGNEVSDVLRPKMQPFEKMTPLDYQAKLSDLIGCLQLLGQSEKRSVVKLIYRDAVRVLQAETVSADLLEEFRIMLLQG